VSAEKLRAAVTLLKCAYAIVINDLDDLERSFTDPNGEIPEPEIRAEVENLRRWIADVDQFFINTRTDV